MVRAAVGAIVRVRATVRITETGVVRVAITALATVGVGVGVTAEGTATAVTISKDRVTAIATSATTVDYAISAPPDHASPLSRDYPPPSKKNLPHVPPTYIKVQT